MANALVTGGAGFIGSHLAERLLSEGHSVTVLDDLITGRVENLSKMSIDPNMRFHQVDISNLDAIQPLFCNIDWVFHLAAKADIVPSIQDPISYHQTNVMGTISVLEAARNEGVKKFLYAASGSCYGIPDEVPTNEESLIRPKYPYALTKYIGEQCVMHWNQVYGLPCISLRLFNVYGTRSRTTGAYGAVFGVFLAQKLAGQPYTVVGDGTQTRDFTYVTDVVDAFVRSAESDIACEIFNVGAGVGHSINELVTLLGGDKIHIAKRPGEPDATLADNRKINTVLGWSPKVSFEEGVAVLLDNVSYWRDAPVWDVNSINQATEDWFKYLGDNVSI